MAKIGSTNYTSLADAIAAVPTDGTQTTITMLADETLALGSKLTVATGKNIVLDLKGKTISGSSDISASFYFITVNGTLKITDTSTGALGKITYASTSTDGSYSKEFVTVYNNGGTLTLANGTVENTSGGGLAYAINNSSNAWGTSITSTFNLTGGRVSAPNGDAALRVYQNCAPGSVQSKNYVNISGGTIDATGIFVDETLYTGGGVPANYDGSNIDTKINISGGTVNGLIDLKIRHPFNTELNITGGDFTNTNLWVRKADGYATACGEPTTPMVNISGGNFDFAGNNAFGLAYDYGTTTWSTYDKPYVISGGTFDVNPSAYLVDGATTATNGDGSYVINAVAQIGSTYYCSLADAVAAVPTDGTQTTINMVANETIVGNAGVTIAAGKNVVLDLNGKTVLLTVTEDKTSQVIQNKGTLTIADNSVGQNGVITHELADGVHAGYYPDYNYSTSVIINNGTLNVTGGTVRSGHMSGSIIYAVDNNNTTSDAILNVSGGAITGEGTLVRQFCNSTTYQNVVNVSGGKIETTGYAAIWTQLPGSSSSSKKNATLNITGGEVTAASYAWYDYSYGDSFEAVDYNISGGTINGYLYSYAVADGVIEGFISGGTFSKAPNSLYCSKGYAVEENPDGSYTVSNANTEVYYYWPKNGGIVGESMLFSEPFTKNYLCDGETIELLKNVTLTSNIACQLTSGSFTLTQGEFAVTKGEYAVTLKAGVSVVTDKQTDIFATEDENSTIVETAVAGGYTYTAKLINYVINDGDAYTFTSDVTGVNATYKRSFGSDRVKKYQGWFVPFDYTITAADLQKFKFFQINMIAHSAVPGETGDSDKLWIHLIRMEENDVLRANTPYIFTPQEEATDYEFTTTNATLKAMTTASVADCSTTNERFDFYGVYSSVHPEDASDIFYYMAKSGQISRATKTSTTVGANRWIFRVTPKDGSQSSVSYSIGFVVNGVEDDDVTAVSSATVEAEGEVVGYYTLSGQQVSEPTKGVYVVKYANGTSKKVVF